ncbi:serine/threonine protein kinase [Dictyobacter arantiisoli]|uniref:non-specific serine/threonine protein kinase n=1 Tax=Dictyobacter arantiisoli TaxID=2014874 RepID=A0A5A5T625_9CHLR|nr:serine/threonine-protein kinase [Dictyobacter arantiisoli]GCF06817.1 hypothetical protein KDI_03810 [Dictyobacter arantiisoli]
MLQEQMSLPPGTVIQGLTGERYVVEALLGQGGFSAVYCARERHGKQTRYALKELINPSSQERGQLTYEARLMRRLSHPSLPQVYQVFEDTRNNRIYMLMDYIEGKNLEVLRREQPEKRFSLALTLTLLTPIVDALVYLHNQKAPVIHRDIKPSNIIIPIGTGDAMLVDFGLAKEYVEGNTTSVFRFGTAGYASPEQYGQGTNTRTDIYALGATLYTLLTGRVPVDAMTRMMKRQPGNSLIAAHNICPSIPSRVSRVIDRAMSLAIEERYATVEEFWQELTIAAVQPATQQISQALTANQPALSQEDIAILTTSHYAIEPQQAAGNKKKAASRPQRLHYGYHPPKKRLERRTIMIRSLLILLLLGGIMDLLLMNIGQHHTSSPLVQTNHGSRATPKIPATAIPDNTLCSTDYAASNSTDSYSILLASCYRGTMEHAGLSLGKSSFQLLNIQQHQNTFTGQFQAQGQQGHFRGSINKQGAMQFTVLLTTGESIKFAGTCTLGGVIAGQGFQIYEQAQQTEEDYGSWTAVAYLNVKH